MLISQFTKISGLLAILPSARFVLGSIGTPFVPVEDLDAAVKVFTLEQLQTGQKLHGDQGTVGSVHLQPNGVIQIAGRADGPAAFTAKVFFDVTPNSDGREFIVKPHAPAHVTLPSSRPRTVGFIVSGAQPRRKPLRSSSGSSNPTFFPVSDEEFDATFRSQTN